MLPVSVKLTGTCKQVQESTSHFLIKKVKALAKSQLGDHLLLCSYDLLFHSFTILAQEINIVLSEIKESLLIKCDKPMLNRNISSALFYNLTRCNMIGQNP